MKILEQSGHDLEVAPTTGPGTAGPIARDWIDRGARLILAAGGDGTINEAAEGMLHSQAALGILSAGTANVLATEMGMPGGFERSAAYLPHCSPHRISVGRITTADGTRHFLLMLGAGLDARIVYNVSLPLKARTGKLAYWVAGWSILGRQLTEFHVEVEGRRHTCSFALISKVRNYGGDFEIARDTSLFDDRFEVVLFAGRSSLRYVKYFSGLIANRLSGMEGVTVLRASAAKLESPRDSRVYAQIDGEYAGRLPAEVSIVPDALTLLIPPGYARKFGAPGL